MANKLQQLHAYISGRVRGVNFRFYTEHKANNLDLTGWVRKLPDGRVEVLAEGDREHLEELLQYLHKGSPAAQVQSVDAEWNDASGNCDHFKTTYATSTT
jgi:acylphosphatase